LLLIRTSGPSVLVPSGQTGTSKPVAPGRGRSLPEISMNAIYRLIRRCTLAGLAAALLAAPAYAQTKLVVGYQLIVGPFLSSIADGSFDKALKETGYQ